MLSRGAGRSPSLADGKLKAFDVITGVEGKPFTYDARRAFGESIAPVEARDGILRVTRWRSGNSEEVELEIGKLLAYGESVHCQRTRQILARAADYVAQGMPKNGFDGVFGSLDALFLMAAGDPAHKPQIRTSARWLTSLDARRSAPARHAAESIERLGEVAVQRHRALSLIRADVHERSQEARSLGEEVRRARVVARDVGEGLLGAERAPG